jgi:hypothetical protein
LMLREAQREDVPLIVAMPADLRDASLRDAPQHEEQVRESATVCC